MLAAFLVVRFVVFLILLPACALNPDSGQQSLSQLASQISAAKAPVYSTLFANVLQPKCVQCHNAQVSDGGIRFDTYDLTMASNTIVPGNATGSTFCSILLSGGLPANAPAPTNTEILEICDWIQAGAANDQAALTSFQQMDTSEEAVFASLSTGLAQRQLLCQSPIGGDAIDQAFCKGYGLPGTAPTLTSLSDLQSILGLSFSNTARSNGQNGNPAFTLVGHSSGLARRFTSSINPQTIIFSPFSQQDSPAIAAGTVSTKPFVAIAFTRGEQFVEIEANDPTPGGGLNFYFVRFKQACNSQPGGCTAADLYSPSIESNWVSFDVFEDDQLANTVINCQHCHQTGGPDQNKFLRMQENTAPFTHFFSSSTTGGAALLSDYNSAHGNENYGGVPGALIGSSNPQLLANFLTNEGNGTQPNAFPSQTVESQITASNSAQPANNATAGVSAAWEAIFNNAVLGQFIPVPYHDVKVTDPTTLPTLVSDYQKLIAGTLTPASFPDLRTALLTSHNSDMALDAAPGLTGPQIITNACTACHNSNLDQTLSSQRFNADLSTMSAAEKEMAVLRLSLPATSPLVMPPPRFMTLTPAEIQLMIQALK